MYFLYQFISFCFILPHFFISFFSHFSILDITRSGYLSPEIQIRNLKLFGTVTSEERYREEHDRFMVTKRKLLYPQYQQGYDESANTDEEDSQQKIDIANL